jgi:chemotaxis signal transduction protein
VCFTLGGRTYAIDVAIVREVVPLGAVLRVARAPRPIRGIFALRGAAVALVETALLLGLPEPPPSRTALVIARGHRTLCGLTIDQVLGVSALTAGRFTPAAPRREPPEVAGFFSDDQHGVITVLDADVIVRSLERLRAQPR